MLKFFLLALFGAIPAFSQEAEKLSPISPITDPRCASVTCPVGTRCTVQNLACREPPCPPPRVQCLPSDPQHPCATKLCPKPLVCKEIQIQCFVPPCYPLAECVRPGNGTGNQCGRNEFFDSCGGCEGTCERKFIACPAICRPPGKCRCSPGFYRNQQGNCVTEAQCDKNGNGTRQCGENEYFNRCGGCDNTCENKNVICNMMCRLPGACRCSQGFYRNQEGKCVTEAQCPNNGNSTTAPQQCPDNEHFDQCGGCDSTCENRNMVCTAVCRPGKCACDQGFYRNQQGRCVSAAQCDAAAATTPVNI